MDSWQQKLFFFLFIGGFLFLFVRLFDIAIIRGGYYREIANGNRTRRIPLYAPRGRILDRNGEVLATNKEIQKIIRFEKAKPIAVLDSQDIDINQDVVVTQYSRVYPAGRASSHVVGYVGQVNREEVDQVGCLDDHTGVVFNLGASIGRMGAERSFDCLLRGKDGEELVEVDSQGRKVRLLGRIPPESGRTITLSIDRRLQERATHALVGQKGAVVALSPRSGEILTLVSSPSFDPNLIASDFWFLASDSDLPLFNRAASGAYPPGSTFKIVTAAAGLEDGKVDENFRFTDTGVITVGAFSYANWFFTQYGRTEGEIDIVRAITRSTDTFFYKVGEFVGVERLGEWAGKFGLGEKTGIDLLGEAGGVIPTPEWKERVRGERWFLGNTYHMSIGQGDITATPLQIAVATGVIADNGRICTPTVKKIEGGKWKVEDCKEVGISQKTVDLITRGMIGACSPGGTAFPLFNFSVTDPHELASASAKPISVACKTGTAEFGDPQDRTHAWLTGFAPSDDPEIVVTALVEVGGEGSRVAAPIVKEVLDEWFSI